MNFAGIHDPRYQGTRLGPAHEVFAQALASIGKPGRLELYKIRPGGWYLPSLREMLTAEFGVHVWVELTIGYSYVGYNTLDLFIRCMNNQTQVPPTEAWYILNSSAPPWYRWRKSPEYWYTCKDWYAYGQKWIVDEHVYEVTGARAPAVVPRGMPSLQDAVPQASSPRSLLADAARLQRMVEQIDWEYKKAVISKL